MNKKILVTVVAAALLLCVAVGGTIAYLTATTSQVVNTFSPSDIEITLEETTGTEYKMVPGATISKNPEVTVKANSEKAYVFVKLEEVGITYDTDKTLAFTDYLTYSVQLTATENDSTVWTKLTDESGKDVTGVYYCVVDARTSDQKFNVLAGNEVTVKDSVTSAMMGYLAEDNYPQLKITAYAVQYYASNTATNDDTAGTPMGAYVAWQKTPGYDAP